MRRARKAQAQPAFNPNVSYGDEHGAQDLRGSVLARKNSVSTDAAAVFRDKEWFLSTMARKKVDTTMQIKGSPGDWVIRESESQAGALVLTFKALNGQVHSKRIKFAQGLFCFDGDSKAYSTIPLLVKSDKNISRAAGDLFGRTLPRRRVSSKALQAVQSLPQPQHASQPQQRRKQPPAVKTATRDRAESLSGFGGFDESEPAKPTKQTDDGFGGFDEEAPAPPAPGRPARAASSEAFGGFDDDEPAASPPPPAPAKAKAPAKELKPGEFLVKCAETDLSSALGLTGECSIKVHETKRQFTVTNHYDGSAKESWTVTALRRYGREEGKFYFEAGRRCASGEGMMYLASDDCDEIFEKVDAHVRSAREEMKAKKAVKQKAIQEANVKRAEAAAQEQKVREAAQAAHAKEAEAEARRRIEEKKQAALQAEKDAEEAERAAAVEKERQEEARKARSKGTGKPKESIYGTVADAMATAAAMTETVSEASKKALATKGPAPMQQRKSFSAKKAGSVAAAAAAAPAPEEPAADPYAGMFQEEEWGAGKSRIWKALNPKPLAYQTRKEKQEKEDGKVDMGIVGSRDFNAVRDLAADMGGGNDDRAADDEHEQMEDGGFDSAFGMEEEAQVDDDMHDNVSEEEDDDEDYDPNAPVDESELMNDDVTSFLGVLQQNREKRAKEEEANKAKLRAEYKARKAIEQVALDKELAIIAAQKKIEHDEAERLKDIAVAAAQVSAESLVFDFSWG